jgi:hypothetical protein
MSAQQLSDDASPLSLERDSQEEAQTGRTTGSLVGLEREELVEGSRPGNTYVRMYMSPVREFRRLGPDRFEATEQATLPSAPLQCKLVRAKRVLIGRPLSTERAFHERLNKIKGLAVLSSDAISSSAYGTETSLAILVVAGAGALALNLGIALVIITLLAIVGLSYRQTIYSYPNGGGSYIVAKDNLGTGAGLVAAASLLIDYVLTDYRNWYIGWDAQASPFAPFHLQHCLTGNVKTFSETGCARIRAS